LACKIDVSLLDFDHLEPDSKNREILIPIKGSDEYVICQNRQGGKSFLYRKEGTIWNEYRITANCNSEIRDRLKDLFQYSL